MGCLWVLWLEFQKAMMCQGLSGLSAEVLMSALGLDQAPGLQGSIKEEWDWRLIILPSRAGSSLDFSLVLCSTHYQTLLLSLSAEHYFTIRVWAEDALIPRTLKMTCKENEICTKQIWCKNTPIFQLSKPRRCILFAKLFCQVLSRVANPFTTEMANWDWIAKRVSSKADAITI